MKVFFKTQDIYFRVIRESAYDNMSDNDININRNLRVALKFNTKPSYKNGN